MSLLGGGVQYRRLEWERVNRAEDIQHRIVEQQRFQIDLIRRQGKVFITLSTFKDVTHLM
jgi:hypothetical protein